MSLWLIILIVVASQALIITMIMSYVIYCVLLRRTKPTKWSRTYSLTGDEEYDRLYNEALAWAQQYSQQTEEVSIQNDGLTLCGQFVDFHADKTVIIIAGRTEACQYSYHFAEPYRKLGYNILAIDNRSHGLSEGKVCSLGFQEYRDILAWGRYLHDVRGSQKVLIHGICIGSSTGLFALTSPDCPDYFQGLTADGMYATFYESFKNHMLEDKRPLFPVLAQVMFYIRVCSKANVVTDGPVKRLVLLKKPILFLHGKEDKYSLPQLTRELYDTCTSKKSLVWFDTGAHSRLRINHPQQYDQAIIDFWGENKI